MAYADLVSIGRIIRKALTYNQLLLLYEARTSRENLTQFLSRVSDYNCIPLSTLKSSVKVLKSMGLLSYDAALGEIRVTGSGEFLLSLLSKSRQGNSPDGSNG